MRPLAFSDQRTFIERCSDGNLSVVAELARRGHDLDDLRYEQHREILPEGDEFRTLDSIDPRPNAVPAVSFFTGAGGMDIGLHWAGFRTLAAFEHEKLFCQTLRKSRLDLHVFGPPMDSGDVKDFEHVVAALESIGVRPGFEGMFHGGPPCQPFSIAANQRFSKGDDNYKRTGFQSEKGGLLGDMLRLVAHFKPRCVLIENVPGLLEIDGGLQLKGYLSELTRIGYSYTEPMLLDARRHGVPQDRKRLFIVAWLGQGHVVPPPLEGIVTVEQALRRSVDDLADHVRRDHQAASLMRYMKLNFGQRDALGRVDRLHPYRPSKTVIAGGLKGGGRSHLHPLVPRTLSPRECARLQTFPDQYQFAGPPARQFTQIGNAVPPVLAYKVGRQIIEGVFEQARRTSIGSALF